MSQTRRTFLRSSICAAMGAASVSCAIGDLRRVAANTQPAGDYKAMVCLFLYGGNDGNNVLIPRSASEYNVYAGARDSLAIPRGQLLPISPLRSDGRDFGLHPSLQEIARLFSRQKLAILANVGTLTRPVTKEEVLSGSAPLPPQLFSHSDQTTHWQTSLPDQAPLTGWGGRVADLLRSTSGNSQISISISLFGSNTFQVGNVVTQYQATPDGSIGLDDFDDGPNPEPISKAIRDLLDQNRLNLHERAFSDVTKRAIENNRILKTALGGVAINTPFPDTGLGKQLKMIARLIAARDRIGLRRQIFFCAADGYDTHANQLAPHAELLGQLSQAVDAFYRATEELGVSNQVTTFTASDFGRTLVSNGSGSDHGWGSHHFILGGAVKGGDIYGKVQTIAPDGPEDMAEGRWVPTTSVDEYSATLARWFGVSSSDLRLVAPNIGRFDNPNLGFMS